MDLEKIRQKLAEHNAAKQQQKSGTQGDPLFWKPKPGTQRVRIVPSPHNPDFPGTELFFYYEFGKPMLAPSSFGLPDPIVKFCNKLKGEKGDKETVSNNWKVANKISAKKRVFVPIIVRGTDGQPDTGPFYWGMAPSYYDEVLKLYADEDYGDISDVDSGRDLTVEFVPPSKEGAFPETFIRPRGNPSRMTDDPVLFEKIKGIKNIVDVYKCPTEEELEAALLAYISGDAGDVAQAKEDKSDTSHEVNKVADEFTEKFEKIFSKQDVNEPESSLSIDDIPF
jgi:hypothetical protein